MLLVTESISFISHLVTHGLSLEDNGKHAIHRSICMWHHCNLTPLIVFDDIRISLVAYLVVVFLVLSTLVVRKKCRKKKRRWRREKTICTVQKWKHWLDKPIPFFFCFFFWLFFSNDNSRYIVQNRQTVFDEGIYHQRKKKPFTFFSHLSTSFPFYFSFGRLM